MIEDSGDGVAQFLLSAGFKRSNLSNQRIIICQAPQSCCGRRFPFALPHRKAGHRRPVLVAPERQTTMARQEVVETILERMPFRKLAPHPARTGSMRNDRGHSTHISDRMPVWLLLNLAQHNQ